MRADYVPRVLVPVVLSDAEEAPALSPLLMELLSSLRVVLLGVYPVPEQTAVSQAEGEFGEDAERRLTEVAAYFDDAGTDVLATRLVYTHDEAQTVERVSSEEDCDAVLIPRRSGRVDRVLVPLRGDVNLKMILYFVAAMVRASGTEVKLVHVASSEEEAEGKELMLKGARESLDSMGVDASRVGVEVLVAKDVVAKLAEISGENDVLVMGESEPSVSTLVLGEIPERVERAARSPVLVVKGPD